MPWSRGTGSSPKKICHAAAVGVFKKSVGGAALLALIAVAALPAGASGRVTYPGLRFGVPFELKVSGVMQKQWTITENTVFCEFSGSGSQTVTFRTAGWTRGRVFSLDRLHSPTPPPPPRPSRATTRPRTPPTTDGRARRRHSTTAAGRAP